MAPLQRMTYPSGTFDERTKNAKTQFEAAQKLLAEGKIDEAYAEIFSIPQFMKYSPVDSLTKENEKLLLEKGSNIHCTVLKVGHHGSNTSSSEEFLQAVAPHYAVICVGAGNSFGHPKAEVLERLRGQGAKVLRTDQDGEIKFSTDGKTMRVEKYIE